MTPATILFANRGHNWIRGSEQCLLDLIERLDRRRFTSVLLCDQPFLAEAALQRGAVVEQFDDSASWGVEDRSARTAARMRIRKLLSVHQPTVIHANRTEILPVLLPEARRVGTAIIAHLHMPIRDDYGRIHDLVHQVDVAVGVSASVVEPLLADGMKRERVRTIFNGVDGERLRAQPNANLRESLGIDANTPLLVSVGSLDVRKAHDITIRAIAILKDEGRSAHLAICGDGPEAAALHALCEQLGVHDRVHFLGYCAHAGAVMREATMVVSASRDETFGLNVVEAQCVGAPVVATSLAAHREALATSAAGWFDNDDFHGLAAVLRALFDDPAGQIAATEAGYINATSRFGIDRYTSEFEELYDHLASSQRRYGWVNSAHWPAVYSRYAVGVLQRRVKRLLAQ